MTDAKPTPGPARVEQDTDLVWGACNPDDNSTRGMGIPIVQGVATGTRTWGRHLDWDERVANAHLIAETFSVHHETNRTPRQLAEERAELVGALGDLLLAIDCADLPKRDFYHERKRARTAIARVRGEG